MFTCAILKIDLDDLNKKGDEIWQYIKNFKTPYKILRC